MHVRILQIGLTAFFCASAIGAPLNKSSLSGAPYSSTGRTVTLGEGNLIAAGASGRSMPSGSGQIGQSGFYYGANGALINPASGQTMTMGLNGDVYFADVKYPFNAGYPVSGKGVADAALGLIGGWPGVAIAASVTAYPYIKDWLDRGGVRPADGGGLEVQQEGDYDFACDVEKYYQGHSGWPAIGSRSNVACGDFPAGTVTLIHKPSHNGSICEVRNSCTGNANSGPMYAQWTTNRKAEPGWLPASMDDIAPYLMRTPFNPAMVNDVIQGGGTVNLPQPNITGPSSVQGLPTTSTSTGTQTINGQQVPTRTETTTQTTYNFTTNNNQITNTTNTTTTTTNTYNQSTGVLIGTSTAVTEAKPEEKDDRSECEKNPKQLNCAQLDTPDGEIPKKQIDVSWSPVDLGLGGGSCPAPVQLGPDKQFSYQATCDNLGLIKPMVLAIAFFIGGMIIFGGRVEQ